MALGLASQLSWLNLVEDHARNLTLPSNDESRYASPWDMDSDVLNVLTSLRSELSSTGLFRNMLVLVLTFGICHLEIQSTWRTYGPLLYILVARASIPPDGGFGGRRADAPAEDADPLQQHTFVKLLTWHRSATSTNISLSSCHLLSLKKHSNISILSYHRLQSRHQATQ